MSDIRSALEMRVGLIIPTLNGGKRWKECVDAIEAQVRKPDRVLVVDSSSDDSTVAVARDAGFEVTSIRRSEFSHGGTRQWAAELLVDCSIVVLLTQDAILADKEALADLVRSFDEPAVAVAYGRQLPHKQAGAIEAHARIFNYGMTSRKKNRAAVLELGSKSYFCSNSFAAYRRSVLLALGGFRRDLILAEDAEFAARAIDAGYENFYCAKAAVHHSHDYTTLQQLARYFDLGVFDARNSWMKKRFGSHGGEGLRFVNSELSYLATHAPLQIPRALLQTMAKVVGYRLGCAERMLPNRLKRLLSMSPAYWRQ